MASVENFLLSDDPDVPIYPESIVQHEVAKALKGTNFFGSIELEARTEGLVRAASGLAPNDTKFPDVGREGFVDIVCWQAFVPQVLVEVKDQINGTDDGIVADVKRLQKLLKISHLWGNKSPMMSIPRFGAIVYFVGKNSQQYKKGKHLASQFEVYSKKSVATSLAKLRKDIDDSTFEILTKAKRVFDSAKDGPPDPELANTEHEEVLTGEEQYTVCVVCVISPKGLNAPPSAETQSI